ncbi:hypothetical protein KHA94_00615 [Bacillus sp. FJAT-49705]|uniref:Yip1 domain-containing protein n=1 Tax=Cytobacillus citreus TaxID=2833586 RepID=A0ABS5NMB3_9BACI|nr:hypothetical protein [Cytobacillus citreus]MBS4188721.1 hypothetical protein [Cytobacillus citreus]
MEETIEIGIGNYIKRKLITTFVTIMLSSIILASYGVLKGTLEGVTNSSNEFVTWFILLIFYIGIIVFIYGNIVSICTEFLQNKYFKKYNWLYVIILGIFGLIPGLFFQVNTFALYGIMAALLYAIVDKWLYKRISESKSIIMFIIVPVIFFFLMWAYFNLDS